MFTPTITSSELKECDLLFYRPTSFFGKCIGIYTRLKHRKVGIAFSHVATVIKGKRFDAMEGHRTGFRDSFENAYVFRIKNISEVEKNKIIDYCLSRENSLYDKRGIISFIFPRIARENEFMDYCSEMIKNAIFSSGIIEDVERISPYELYCVMRDRLDFIGIII